MVYMPCTTKLASSIDRVQHFVRGQVAHETQNALQVIRLPVLNKQRNHQGRQEERHRLKCLEMQRHVTSHDPAEHDQERRDEEGDLQTAADGNTDREVHLVLVRDHNRRHVFGGVADDRDEDQADERLADVRGLDDRVYAVDEVLGADGDAERDDYQDGAGCPGG